MSSEYGIRSDYSLDCIYSLYSDNRLAGISFTAIRAKPSEPKAESRKPKPKADIDRQVLERESNTPQRFRLSDLRDRPRYVLLGEPGSGKSTAFQREAEAAGIQPVTARQFVSGGRHRPQGTTVFIDALEEYRIGEAGIDRLATLIEALEEAG